MADYQVIIEGGPCAGQTRTLTADQLRAGHFNCQGTVYVPYGVTTKTGYHVWVTAVSQQTTKAANRAYSTSSVAQAWGRFARALGHTAPTEVRKLEQHTARLRRIAR